MTLFQNSVLNKYIKDINQEALEEAWNGFTKHFHDPKVQENIRSHNEEQYQAKFLMDLFVNILGYTLNPDPDYNLITEQKNEKDSKKADGAILKDDKVIVVIELKGTNTTDLNKIEAQAFGYKSNQANCNYVVTSNFEKLRFYIDNAIDYEEFNLFTLSKERFAVLWLCLAKENVFKSIPKKIKELSLTQEETITKQLYKDYAQFRNVLFENIVSSNPHFDKLTLFNKTQKLLDRLLFIFFAEDRLLLPPNSIREIVSQWTELKENYDEHFPLYDRFKKYFNYMNTGYKGKQHEIFAYNGGLFAPDEVLDNIKIDDKLLHEHSVRLSDYDFESEVSVNILGHIFEHSLNDIEQIQNELAGVETEKSKTKRKKDGVFYTPNYITKYIVDNTLGKLCDEKKEEFGVIEEDYNKDPKGRKKATIKKLNDKLDKYRDWLLQVTICDPACGSGAFLNQALEFLITEHRYIDELVQNLFGDSIPFPNIENAILENNLYGVDINEESIEIAKLSLWLRTAQKGRKLTSLNNNIKCGNSLIDDKEVAGDKAFHWESEFPQVFKKEGFDIVIGNPPYVNINTLPSKTHEYFKAKYGEIHTGYNDLMYYFLYKGIDILNGTGLFGVITSNYFIGNEYAKSLRGFLSSYVSSIVNFGDYLIFHDANVHTALVFAQKNSLPKFVEYKALSNNKNTILGIEHDKFDTIKKERELLKEYWIFASLDKNLILEKVASKGKLLGSIAEIEKGSTSGKNEVFTVNQKVVEKYNLESEALRKNVKNGDILRYCLNDRGTFLIYTDNNTEIEKIPNVMNYFKKHKEILSERNEVKKGSYDWWRMERPRKKEIYDASEKIIVPYRATSNRFALDIEQRFNDGGDIRVILILDKSVQTKYVLGLLNSKLLDWYYGFIGKPKGKSREYFNEPLAKIPILIANDDTQNSLVNLVESISEEINKKLILNNKFISYLMKTFSLEKVSNKLQGWYDLDFSTFIKEINKAIKKTGMIKLSKLDEMEWAEVFESQLTKGNSIKAKIKKYDKEIDQMVYALYELTPEEIEIVEGS